MTTHSGVSIKEIQRRRLIVGRAASVQSRLLFIIGALRHLFNDPEFARLVRREFLQTLPRPLAERVGFPTRHRITRR
jgi:ParB family transcriptional regulator, chromosome partitioning protein